MTKQAALVRWYDPNVGQELKQFDERPWELTKDYRDYLVDSAQVPESWHGDQGPGLTLDHPPMRKRLLKWELSRVRPRFKPQAQGAMVVIGLITGWRDRDSCARFPNKALPP